LKTKKTTTPTPKVEQNAHHLKTKANSCTVVANIPSVTPEARNALLQALGGGGQKSTG
jgi:hypothetical protein